MKIVLYPLVNTGKANLSFSLYLVPQLLLVLAKNVFSKTVVSSVIKMILFCYFFL